MAQSKYARRFTFALFFKLQKPFARYKQFSNEGGYLHRRVSLSYAMQVSEQDRLENLFFTQGFRVSFVLYENVAKDFGLDLAPQREQCGRVLFVAEQLRFSDAQMESFWTHFERTEEDADEEGFEEL
uniref:Uncharacterized protein n=1 Tax=Aegilops tauschii TaxID=37682 RepID=M8BSI8_AEGTA